MGLDHIHGFLIIATGAFNKLWALAHRLRLLHAFERRVIVFVEHGKFAVFAPEGTGTVAHPRAQSIVSLLIPTATSNKLMKILCTHLIRALRLSNLS